MPEQTSFKTTKRLVLIAVFSAIIFVFTAYVIHIPIGTGAAYMDLGDTFIFFAATLLPFPDALFAAAIGSALGDFMAGSPIWIPFTIIIKPLMALCFTSQGSKILSSRRNIIAPFAANSICLVGYYLAETIIYGNILVPIASLPGGIAEWFSTTILFFIIAKAVDKRNLKEVIHTINI